MKKIEKLKKMLIMFSVANSILMINSVVISANVSYTRPIPGDVNLDTVVNLEDVQLALDAVLGVTTLSDDAKIAADVDGDGEVTLTDVDIIMNMALGIE